MNLDQVSADTQREVALSAGQVWREFSSAVQKAARSLVKRVGGTPAEILLQATDRAGRVEIKTVPFTTPALAAAAVAADAIAVESALPAPHDPEICMIRKSSPKATGAEPASPES